MGGALCPRFTLSPGGEFHLPWVELCADMGLGLIREQKVQWAEAASTRDGQGLRPLDGLPVTVIAELNPGRGGMAGGGRRPPPHVHQRGAGVPHHQGLEQARGDCGVATWGSGEPRPVDSRKRTLPPKLPRLHHQLTISDCSLEHGTHIEHTGRDDLEPNKAET